MTGSSPEGSEEHTTGHIAHGVPVVGGDREIQHGRWLTSSGRRL